MKSDFWYPFYVDKFRGATRHLTAEQDGIYRRLIDEYMITREPLPDNDVALMRIAGITNENSWLHAKRIVMAYFTHADGMFFHDFCDQQLDIQDKKSKRRSLAAEKAAKKRWSKPKQIQGDIFDTHAERNANAMRPDATETETETDIRIESPNLYMVAFEEFWRAYPKRDGTNPKAPAKKSFQKWIKAKVSPDDILAGAKAYAEAMKRTGQFATPYVSQAVTWLNQQRWKDDYEQIGHGDQKPGTVHGYGRGAKTPAGGRRSEAAIAIEITEQIIARRNAEAENSGQSTGKKPTEPPSLPNLRSSEKVR